MFADVIAIIATAAPLILQAEAMVGDGNGAAKKQQVITAIDAEIAKPGGIEYPSWLPAMARPVVISACIEVAHFLFERAGGAALVKKLLGSSNAPSSSGSPTAQPSSGKS